MSFIARIPRRVPPPLERNLARRWRAEQADLACRGLLRLADTAEPPARQRIIDMGYCEGAKAGLLRALADGDLREARMALRCWRLLHRATYGRKGGRA